MTNLRSAATWRPAKVIGIQAKTGTIARMPSVERHAAFTRQIPSHYTAHRKVAVRHLGIAAAQPNSPQFVGIGSEAPGSVLIALVPASASVGLSYVR
jgi:hypothetical protein